MNTCICDDDDDDDDGDDVYFNRLHAYMLNIHIRKKKSIYIIT
jgi:hypothetical protein